ncbi:MAG: IS66 family insertion sequence element accessory protein TnpB [Bacteroidales bacterium]|nr:IS66 family insertion sequence element accessory protein TnpB [Bacteroidales bacterium]MCD8395244.1 IS66 family insertion sequence element accessory protein TnpB [Bacteroidales bacterium]
MWEQHWLKAKGYKFPVIAIVDNLHNPLEIVEVMSGGGAVDMRNGIRGLGLIVEGEFELNASSGDAFVFFSRDVSAVKILRWDGDGFIVYHKRLARGTFERVDENGAHAARFEIPWQRLCLVKQGISLKSRSVRFI